VVLLLLTVTLRREPTPFRVSNHDIRAIFELLIVIEGPCSLNTILLVETTFFVTALVPPFRSIIKGRE
jgi:hypothetical protein